MTNLKMTISAMVLAALAAGCDEPFDSAALIERTRVLGARVEVTGDPERSTPRPEETATVTWLVEAPGLMPPLTWAFVVCPSASVSAATCSTAPFVTKQGTGHPRFDLTVPATAALSGARRLLVMGQVCTGHEPRLEGGQGACGPGERGTTAILDLPLAVDTEPNRNPILTERPLWFAGQPWDAKATTCEGLPRVAAGSTGHVIRLETQGQDRERFTAVIGEPPAPVAMRETLQISQFATAGKMESAYSFVEATDDRSPAEVEVKWDAPKPEVVADQGMEVRFTFVERDQRGGVDWTQRTVCVTK